MALYIVKWYSVCRLSGFRKRRIDIDVEYNTPVTQWVNTASMGNIALLWLWVNTASMWNITLRWHCELTLPSMGNITLLWHCELILPSMGNITLLWHCELTLPAHSPFCSAQGSKTSQRAEASSFYDSDDNNSSQVKIETQMITIKSSQVSFVYGTIPLPLIIWVHLIATKELHLFI